MHICNKLLQLKLVLLNSALCYTLDQIYSIFSLDFHTNRSHHLEAHLHTTIANMAEPAAPPPPFDPATFDPWHQDINMYRPDGALLTVNMGLVDEYRLYTTRLSISFGSQIGASLMLLLVLVLLTRSEKRKSLIFILNACCLFFNTIRLIFASCYLTGNLMHPYGLLSGNYFSTPTDIAVSVTSNTLSFIVLAFVMASLSLQVWVACVTTSTLQRILIMGTTTAMALVSLGFKFAFMVASHIALVESKVRDVDKLSAITWITQGVAIMLYSCVFTWKLGYAIVERRRLNMLQFGPMQIVFIMGCQTMIIPGKFLLWYCCTLLTFDSSLVGYPVCPGHSGQNSRDWQPGSHRGLHLPSHVSHLGRRRQRLYGRPQRPRCSPPVDSRPIWSRLFRDCHNRQRHCCGQEPPNELFLVHVCKEGRWSGLVQVQSYEEAEHDGR